MANKGWKPREPLLSPKREVFCSRLETDHDSLLPLRRKPPAMTDCTNGPGLVGTPTERPKP